MVAQYAVNTEIIMAADQLAERQIENIEETLLITFTAIATGWINIVAEHQ